ncbi:hypothetical protein AC579_8775 [Pseudocercospora musae]|uniref:ATP synthase subunit delta, mitochondrial n=1 Tax=Pseudocercospora musae TaxID=113226 RepID=A0A139IWB1_9PEZI|nr:hypothetical protein AC579_8775 [Pseudocercospora musae]
MQSLRVARTALRASQTAFRAAPALRRGYADVAPDKIQLTLALPHQRTPTSTNSEKSRKTDVNANSVQVNIPAESGEMGVLASHVPSIEQLKPGLVEVIEEQGGSKQFFLSGGFATVQPNSVLSINAVEGYPLEDFSAEAVRNQIAEAQKIANGGGSEQDVAEAKIELEGTVNALRTANNGSRPRTETMPKSARKVRQTDSRVTIAEPAKRKATLPTDETSSPEGSPKPLGRKLTGEFKRKRSLTDSLKTLFTHKDYTEDENGSTRSTTNLSAAGSEDSPFDVEQAHAQANARARIAPRSGGQFFDQDLREHIAAHRARLQGRDVSGRKYWLSTRPLGGSQRPSAPSQTPVEVASQYPVSITTEPTAKQATEVQGEVEAQLDGVADGLSTQTKPAKVNVADRIRAFEQKDNKVILSKPMPKYRKARAVPDDVDEDRGSAGPNEKEERVPLVFPLHVQKFKRRGTMSSPKRAETPLYRAQPGEDAIIHAPAPQRTIPPMKTPVDEHLVSPVNAATTSGDGPRSNARAEEVEANPGGSRKTSTDTEKLSSKTRTKTFDPAARIPPTAHLHRMRQHCVRHGRKSSQASQQDFSSKRNVFEKARNVPKHNDACPDCVAELGIRRRETIQAAPAESTLSFRRSNSKSEQERLLFGSISPEPILKPQANDDLLHFGRDEPVEAVTKQMSTRYSPDTTVDNSLEVQPPASGSSESSDSDDAEESPRNVRFRSSISPVASGESNEPNNEDNEDALITTSDLGDGLDAVILERGGCLERIILNERNGTPTPETIARISRELYRISTVLATTDTKQRISTNGTDSLSGDRTIVLDTYHDRDTSVTGLLDAIDTATPGLGIMRTNSIRVRTSSSSTEPVSIVRDFALTNNDPPFYVEEQPLSTPGQRIVNRQRIDADYFQLHKQYGNNGAAIPDLTKADHGAEGRLEARAARWPLSQATPLGAGEDPLAKHMADLDKSMLEPTSAKKRLNFGSEDVTIRIYSPGIPVKHKNGNQDAVLPSHILTAEDLSPQPPTPPVYHGLSIPQPSPTFFTTSTCPSSDSSPTILSGVQDIPATSARDKREEVPFASDLGRYFATTKSDSANSAIKTAIRMDRNHAVQQAAAIEREMRRKKTIAREAKRALD